MRRAWCLLVLMCYVRLAACNDPCVFELECEECLPEHMPLVTSHRAVNGSVVAADGDEVLLSCAGGNFLRYPLVGALAAECEAGRLRVRTDRALRHLLDLGCQENVFEDVQHEVEHCAPPLQGRAYIVSPGGGGPPRHLATACFSPDRALPVRLHVANSPRNELRMAPHQDHTAPLSLLGNFNHMFDAKTRSDAERLYSDEVRMNRRLHQLLKHERVTFAAQTLTSGKLLAGAYFEDQSTRVADFVSNRVAVWSSVSSGNVQHLQSDVAALLRHALPHDADVHVYAGTHGVMALRTGRGHSAGLYLKPDRFPVPKYLWTVVHDKKHHKALAVMVLNDPFVAVSEIRASVLCDSACGRAAWLRALTRHRRYETPLYGLAFCCGVHDFTRHVDEMPAHLLGDVLRGDRGLLLDAPAA